MAAKTRRLRSNRPRPQPVSVVIRSVGWRDGSRAVGRAPAVALWVDPTVHAAEVARFRSKIVAGPGDKNCNIWVGGIGADGYGRYFITRAGMGLCVRPHRYALALATGSAVGADVFALHECDNPVCVKVSGFWGAA